MRDVFIITMTTLLVADFIQRVREPRTEKLAFVVNGAMIICGVIAYFGS